MKCCSLYVFSQMLLLRNPEEHLRETGKVKGSEIQRQLCGHPQRRKENQERTNTKRQGRTFSHVGQARGRMSSLRDQF